MRIDWGMFAHHHDNPCPHHNLSLKIRYQYGKQYTWTVCDDCLEVIG